MSKNTKYDVLQKFFKNFEKYCCNFKIVPCVYYLYKKKTNTTPTNILYNKIIIYKTNIF